MRHTHGRTRRTAAALLAATAALALAGCGEQQAGGGQAGDEQTVRPQDPTPSAAPSPFEQRAAVIEKNWPDVTPAKDSGLMPLQGVEPLKAGDLTLTVTVGHGACDTDWGVHLEESAELVILGGWHEADENEFCTEQLVTDEVRVELDEELGGRTVVDAATGEAVAGNGSGSGG
ncbi:hypothetical protein V1J52_20260 [Streptomyces sp. TRM 70351]|uniref:hypothetical protein n=1 Tax=Streptomyces sp. TRM 70351 TaxID=3116552 RepID=UPI002E7B329A|nr:hypothetical protein [Streptomyces sp. TRM 70351]MEE1930490.1 hypothetical protein [Streptomyces sp. TRM 70351]